MMKLRKRYPIDYYEPPDPSFDDYVYCDQCADCVYEYCSIHGGLLVIPDDVVPAKTNYPSFVPRAALTIPKVFLHLAPSIIPGAGIGVFSTLTLPRGVRLGPYRGDFTSDPQSVYCWQLRDRDGRNNGVVDAKDPNSSNWMRYVNCARHWCEQNLVAYQYQGQIYYRTIKIIPRYTELLVFYGNKAARLLKINLRHYDDERFYAEAIAKPLKVTLIEKQVTGNLLIEDIEELPSYEDVIITDERKSVDANQNVVFKSNDNIETCSIDDSDVIEEENLFNDDLTPEVEENFYDSSPSVEHDEKTNSSTPTDFESKETENNNDKTLNKNETTCNKCKRNCFTSNNLRLHMESIHGRICPWCAFESTTRKNLLRHIKGVHGKTAHEVNKSINERIQEEVPLSNICNLCDNVFMTKASLAYHLKYTHGSKLLHCTFCEYKTYRKIALQSHIKIHANSTESCDVCNRAFTSKSCLARHIKERHPANIFSCTFCTFKTYVKDSFQNHTKIHTTCTNSQEETYSCHLCIIKYRTKKSLSQHIKFYHSKNMYNCTYCKFKTYLKVSYERHIEYHKKSFEAAKITYKCNKCHFTSAYKSYLIRHEKRVHEKYEY